MQQKEVSSVLGPLLVTILDFQPVNERLALLRFKAKFSNITIISARAPTDDPENDKFYAKVQTVMDALPQYKVRILLQCKCKNREEKVLQKYGWEPKFSCSN